MLVVSRKAGEKVMLGDDTFILVSKVKGKKVILGIQAPKDIKVYREEVYDKINKELREIASEVVNEPLPMREDVSNREEEPYKYERMGWK